MAVSRASSLTIFGVRGRAISARGGGPPAFSALGGTTYDVTLSGVDYRVHAFTSTDNFTTSTSGEVDVLIVAGGGGGGGSPHGGGAGGGGVVYATGVQVSSGIHAITIGGGGTGKTGSNSSPWPPALTNKGTNGGNSTAFGYTALGGGGGGGYSGGGSNDTPGQNGGSGGGGTDESSGGTATQPGSASGGYGNNGAESTSNTYGGGGGGAGGAPTGTYLEDGGVGLNMSLYFGTSYGEAGYFAGGGGGSGYATSDKGTGGTGGGGDGGANSGQNPQDGTVNTGGGGGGQERYADTIGGHGGSGIVLVRYQI